MHKVLKLLLPTSQLGLVGLLGCCYSVTADSLNTTSGSLRCSHTWHTMYVARGTPLGCTVYCVRASPVDD